MLVTLLTTSLILTGVSLGETVTVSNPVKTINHSRAGDQLSPAEFAYPPVHSRPGSFWDWLNGAMTKESGRREILTPAPHTTLLLPTS